MLDTQQAVARLSGACSLDQLYDVLADVGMGPGWNKPEPSLWPAPRKTLVPAHWSYRIGKAALDAAAPLIGTELAERRNLILANPVEGNTYGTSRTLVAAYQMVKAGEVARSHRHTPNALRLVVDTAPKAYTIVQGRKIPMRPGDVLLTPNWLWHGHANEGDAAAYWIDVLDAPLAQLLEPMFLEHFPTGIEKTDEIDETSPMIFPIGTTMARLDAAPPAADESRSIELGSPALDTIGLHVLRLKAEKPTTTLQTTASNIYAVIDGEGESEIDGRIFTWERGDVLVAPAWRRHSHSASTATAHLLRVTDEPALKHLGWLRSGGA
jgi:gentisate 1,2-dioxygenase